MEFREQLSSTLGSGYTLERELGGGGMSRVFVADEHRLGRQVVIKVLSPDLAAGINVERFEREIRLAASLQQANIVPVLSAGDTDGLPFYTMPFVDGESLRARLARTGAVGITETLRILGDVARALQYAHQHGVVHRDIKPDNVLLSGGTAVVTDFGIAKALVASKTDAEATLTQLGTAIGTPAYMSPEQAAGDPDIDHRTDIYAFGCMAYELLAGQSPFAGRGPQRVLAAHMTETPRPVLELRPDAPATLADLVMRCLAKDATDRPQSAAEVIGVLDSVTSGGSLSALPPVLIGGPAMFRRALAWYAITFVLVAIVARAATIAVGLPDWVFPGALIVMGLGLPVVLLTGYVQRVTHRALTATPRSRGEASAIATFALKASPHLSWRRTMLGGAYAFGAFILAVGLFMVLRSLGIGPAGSLLSRGSVSQREPLLIADFRSPGDTNLGNVVTEAVRADLAQSRVVTLVQPSRILAALQRMQLPPSTRLGLDVAREIGEREGIKAIVDGEITPVGTGYVVAVRLVSVDSAQVLTSFRASVASPADLIDGIEKVSRKLRGKIGESLRDVQASPPLSRVTTTSLDALRKYTEASRAGRLSDFRLAVALARQAVAIDSTFGSAWALLASYTTSGGFPLPQSTQDSAVAMAFRFRDRLSDPEGFLARYYWAGPGRDPRRGLELAERVFARDSTAGTANAFGIVLVTQRHYARAESIYKFAQRRDTTAAFAFANILPPQVNLGKLGAADSSLAVLRRRFPGFLTGIPMSAALRYHHGDLAGYRRISDSMATSRSPRLQVEGSYNLAELYALTGRLRDHERQLARARSLDSANGRMNPVIVDSIAAAMFDAWFRGNAGRAADRLDASLARYPLTTLAPADRPYFAAATAYARASRPDRARAVLREFETLPDTSLRRYWQSDYHSALGEIALAEGNPRTAIDAFRRADTLPRSNRSPYGDDESGRYVNLGRAFDAMNQPDSAIAMFERYLSVPHYRRYLGNSDPLFRAAVHKRLGELYDARGDRAKAVASFSAFVELWKDADPDLQPKVAAVRSRLSRIRRGE